MFMLELSFPLFSFQSCLFWHRIIQRSLQSFYLQLAYAVLYRAGLQKSSAGMASLYRTIIYLSLFLTLSLCETSSDISPLDVYWNKKVLLSHTGSQNDHSVIFSMFISFAHTISSCWKATSS